MIRNIPTYLMVSNLGMVDTLWGVIVPNAISTTNMIIMRTYFQNSIPESLYEAATLDGSNYTKYLLRVVLPLSMPIVAVIGLYYGVGHWNNYFDALIYLRSTEKQSLQLVLRNILLANQVNSGDGSYSEASKLGSLTRPAIAEQLAVENVLAIAKKTGTRLCIAHASSRETVAILRRERAAGNRNFLLESCPHYMQFTRENMAGPRGALYTINPPLRGREDAECLLEAAVREEISILSTDHCPYSRRYKLGTNYETVPCGVDGVQTRMQ